MKKISVTIFSIILGICSISIMAQDRWATVFGDEGAEFSYDIRQTTDSGFIVSGYGSDGGTSDFYLIRLSNTGITRWEKTVDLSNYSERGFSVTETADGGFVVFGNGGAGNWPFAVKVNAEGYTIWTTTEWSEQLPYHRAVLAYGTELPDGRLAMITLDNMNKPWKYLINTDGSLLEETELTSIVPPVWYSGTFTNDLEKTSDGGFVIAGATNAGPGGGAFIWKFDANADSSWSSTYPSAETGMLYAASVKQTADGGYLLTGPGNYNSSASAVVRTNESGDLLWAETYSDTSANYRRGADIAEHENGNLFVVENKFSAFGTTIFKSDILEIDPNGNLVSRHPLIGSDTSTKVERIISTFDGSLVLAGWLKNVRDVAETDLYVLKANADGIFPECVFDCVWPGDANNDGIVDMNDLMALGFSNGLQGPARNNPSIDWYGQSAFAWIDSIPGDVNAKYTDCNGDGISNTDDTLAIAQNFQFAHPINPFKSGTGNEAPLYVPEDQFEMIDVNTFMVPVFLGTPDNQVDQFYGAHFRLLFQSEWIEEGSVRLKFQNTWVKSDDEILDLSIKHPLENMVVAGITRMDQNPVSGYGLFAHLIFQLKDGFEGVPSGEIEINLTFEDIAAHNQIPQPIDISGGEFVITIPTGITSIGNNRPNQTGFTVFPNPVKGNSVQISSISDRAEFLIIHPSGNVIMNRFPVSEVEHIDLSGIRPGIYFIKMIGDNNFTTVEKLIIR